MTVLKRLTSQVASLTQPGATTQNALGTEFDTWVPDVNNATPDFTLVTKGATLVTDPLVPGYPKATVFKPDPNQKDMFLTATKSFTISSGAAATNIITTSPAHGLALGDKVRFTSLTGGTGLDTVTDYFVVSSGLTSTTFKVSALRGTASAAVDFTTDISAGAGTAHAYAGGRPRCMGNLSKDAPPDPLPDGSPNPYTWINGVDPAVAISRGETAPSEVWYELWLKIPSDFLVPAAAVPAVLFAWHGESGRINTTDPNAIRYDYPPFQIHLKRLTGTGALNKLGMYVRHLGGRYRPVSQGAPTVPIDGWTWEGIHTKPSFGSENYYVETDREYDVFPAGAAPLNEVIYIRMAIKWRSDPTTGRFRLWTKLAADPDLVLAIDSTTTSYYKYTPNLVTTPVSPANGGANIFLHPDYPLEFVNNGHLEQGYYRPQEGPNSSNYQAQVFTDSFKQTGLLITDTVNDLTGPEGPPTPATLPPVNTTLPVLVGVTRSGETLTCTQGEWSGDPVVSYTFQWKRDGANITGETASTYLLTMDDVGTAITCTATATNTAGSGSGTSLPVTVTAPPLPTVTIPALTGVVLSGQTHIVQLGA